MSTLKVANLMTKDVVALTPEDSLAALYDVMMTRMIRHVPVVDNDELVGLVSHRDLVGACLGEESDLPLANRHQTLEEVTVADIMVKDIESVEADLDITAAAQLMLENKLGCLPVTEGDRLTGILTESDFVRYVSETAG